MERFILFWDLLFISHELYYLTYFRLKFPRKFSPQISFPKKWNRSILPLEQKIIFFTQSYFDAQFGMAREASQWIRNVTNLVWICFFGNKNRKVCIATEIIDPNTSVIRNLSVIRNISSLGTRSSFSTYISDVSKTYHTIIDHYQWFNRISENYWWYSWKT